VGQNQNKSTLLILSEYAWASAHRGKWGQLTSLEEMDEKLKSENMQKRE